MSALPSGTVTFLFTDIEGSTARWERDRQAMAAAVARHLALLDAAVQAHDGVLFKVVGDAVQAAFPTAPAAIATALEAQQAILAEDWGEHGPLQVRMALHAGEAEPDDRGDYLASPLNRLSRLLSSGHGGQILVSQAVQQLGRDALPVTVTMRDLGEHRLRDLLEPERIFQLQHVELPAEFPPLQTLDAHPHNLPIQLTPLVGRERDVENLSLLLTQQGVQLLTLTGPGGTGKTRLALAAAAESLAAFPQGAWFIDLSSLADPALVLPTIAATLGVHEGGLQSLQEACVTFLASRRLLLVLDNYEHLLAAALVVSDLLRAGSEVAILVTSRSALRLRGEREVAVPPLQLPKPDKILTRGALGQVPAIALFVQRAQAAKADFALTDADAATIAAICDRLDGLPLAIELAAARVKALPLSSILSRLEHRLPLLTTGSRDAPQRQRTLRDSIAWSHDLLSPSEQSLFRSLGVFVGGWTLEAAEAVTNVDGNVDVLDALTSLIDKSLVRLDESGSAPRYRMLETIREYAVERLHESPDEERLRRAHVEYLLQFARNHDLEERGPTFEERLAQLAAEESNLRTAIDWTLERDHEAALGLIAAFGDYWWLQGWFVEGLNLHERVLATGVGPNTPERAQALNQEAWLAINRGELPRAEALANTSLALAERLGEARHAAYARYCLGSAANSRGDVARATALLEEALAQFEALGDVWRASSCLNRSRVRGVRPGGCGDGSLLLRTCLRYRARASRHQSRSRDGPQQPGICLPLPRASRRGAGVVPGGTGAG